MTLRCTLQKSTLLWDCHCCRAANHPVMVKANNFQCSNDGGDDDDGGGDDDCRRNNDFVRRLTCSSVQISFCTGSD